MNDFVLAYAIFKEANGAARDTAVSTAALFSVGTKVSMKPYA
jgi:hypothetical protein